MIEVSEIVQVINITVSDVTETANITVTEQSNPLTLAVAEMGLRGFQGIQGLSAYEVAVSNGFLGTQAQWLASLVPITVKNEVPNGLVNGINATFTSVNNFVSGTLELFLNGSLQKIINDYQIIANNTIILNTSPTTGENILINYTKQ